MPILPRVGGSSWQVRGAVWTCYAVLCVLGVTMVTPFLVTVSASLSNDFDYEKYHPVPRYLYSRTERFGKGLVQYFNTYTNWAQQMRARFDVPEDWLGWRRIGRDTDRMDDLAARFLPDPKPETWRRQAADYSDFVDAYPLEDMVGPVDNSDAAGFLARRYSDLWTAQHPGEPGGPHALGLLSQAWDVPYRSFFALSFQREVRLPLHQQSFHFPQDEKFTDYLRVLEAQRAHAFSQGVRAKWETFLGDQAGWASDGPVPFPVVTASPPARRELWQRFKREQAPAAPVVPFAMRVVWRDYLQGEEVRARLGLQGSERFNAGIYNRLARTSYASLRDTPFPLTGDEPAGIADLWRRFVESRFPLRLTSIVVTPELTGRYHDLLRGRFRNLEYANRILGTMATAWSDFELTPLAPRRAMADDPQLAIWYDFVKGLDANRRVLTSSEHRYQGFLLQRYGSLRQINEVYGWSLSRLEEAFPPFDVAYAVTFAQNETGFVLGPLVRNYSLIIEYLLHRGRALPVTLLLVVLAVLSTLTINPMAAYALSRFHLRGTEKVILYILAPMAFPAMVSAIPAYLLMRDLGMLNTFLALILPGAANGMAIFILKGFFDSLPKELYEAATIDGAPEWQIFLRVTMPMMKPILAINSLNAFLFAYTSWEWALIVCQDQSMWTLSVWLYQANIWWAAKPWIVMAGFVVASIPTLLVFLFCQKIILRGIIIPSMK